MQNDYPTFLLVFRPEIERVRAHLSVGKPASEIANLLHAQGVGNIHLLMIFREATGASLGHLKALGQWWGANGVTDTEAFDSWVSEILPADPPSP